MSEKKRYEVPVFDFDWGDNYVVPRRASEDREVYIRVEKQEWQYGNCVINTAYVQGEDINRYNFKITNEDDFICRYKGDEPENLPVEIQHAVYAFGYGIQNVDTFDERIFEALEASEITSELRRLIESDELPLIIEWLLEDTVMIFQVLSAYLTARAVLSKKEYASLWVDALKESNRDGLSVETLSDVVTERLNQQNLEEIEFIDNELTVDRGIGLTEVTTDGSKKILADYITPSDVTRFKFFEVGDGEYVCEGITNSYVPPKMVRVLEERGKTITNQDSIVDTQTDLEVLEQATLFAKAAKDMSLVPDHRFEPMEIANAAYERVSSATVWMALFTLSDGIAQVTHDEICDQIPINSPEQLSESAGTKFLDIFGENIPSDVVAEWHEYMEAHPAYTKPKDLI